MTKIPEQMRPDMSALRRLVLATCLVFIGFLVFSLTAFISLFYVGKDLDTLIERNLIPTMESARMALDIGRSLSEVNYILSVCNDTDFSDEKISHHTLDSFTALADDTKDRALRDSLSQFTKVFDTTLVNCLSVQQIIKEINFTSQQLGDTIKSLDESVSNLIIDGKINGLDTSVLERLPLSITQFAQLQLRIESLFPRLGVVFFEKELNRKNHPVFANLDEFSMEAKILFGYGTKIGEHGVRIANLLQHLVDLTEKYHRVAGTYFRNKQGLTTSKESLLTYMKDAESTLQVSSQQRADSLKKNFKWIPYASFLLVCSPLIIMFFSFLLARSAYKSLKRTGESEAKYRTLIENLPQQIFVKDKNSVYISCNEKFARFIDMPSHMLIGKKDTDLFPDEIASQYQTEDARVMSSGEILTFEQPSYTESAPEVIVQVVKTPLQDSKGNVVGVLGFFWDITERKRAEEELQSFAQRLAIHVDQTPLGVIEWDLSFKVTQWNKAAENIFGYTKEEVLGQHAADIIVPASAREQVDRVWVDLVSKKGGKQSTNQNISKDGQILICDWYNTTLVNSKGVVVGVASLVMDISERKELESRLRQTHKMEAIGTLAGGIAHDFNNILAAILGYADMAKDDIPDYSPARHQIDQVLKAGNRAKELVKHILSFSRKEIQTRKPVSIYLIVQEAIKFLRAMIPTTVEFKVDLDEDCGNILADSTQIHQVIVNLCTNACQAIEDNGGVMEVSLLTHEYSENDLNEGMEIHPGSYVMLSVKDNGPGIDSKIIDRVFDPYFTTKDVGKGSGMGLAIVHGIMKSHDGIITVNSIPGSGTTFTALFPKIRESIERESVHTEILQTGHENILVVDDEIIMADMTKMRLERLGYQVTAKTDSVEALELFRTQPDFFDLVITDQTMPRLTGEQFAKELLRIKPDMPIILCTGYSSKVNKERAKTLGIKAFAMKPVDKAELAQLIRTVLGTS